MHCIFCSFVCKFLIVVWLSGWSCWIIQYTGLEINFFAQVPAGDKRGKSVCQIKNFSCHFFYLFCFVFFFFFTDSYITITFCVCVLISLLVSLLSYFSQYLLLCMKTKFFDNIHSSLSKVILLLSECFDDFLRCVEH